MFERLLLILPFNMYGVPSDYSVGLSSGEFLLIHHTTVILTLIETISSRELSPINYFPLSRLPNHFSPPAQWPLPVPHPSHPAHPYPCSPAPIQKRRCSPQCGFLCRFSAVAPSPVAATSGSRSVTGSCCICARARQGWRYETFGCAREGSRLR